MDENRAAKILHANTGNKYVTTRPRIYVYNCHAQCHCDQKTVIVEGDQTTTPTATRYVYIANYWQKSPRQKV